MKLILPLFVAFAFSACNLGTYPKTIGTVSKFSLSIPENNTVIPGTFGLSFGIRDSSSSTIVRVQALPDSASVMKDRCTTSFAEGCKCFFYETLAGGSKREQDGDIFYYEDHNAFKCEIPSDADITSMNYVAINDGKGSTTEIVKIFQGDQSSGDFALALKDLMKGLEVSRVRKVFSYSCDYNYIQKTDFTGSTSAVGCADEPDNNDLFYGLVVRYTYYLYNDNFSSNLHQRGSDYLYANGNFCSLVARQIDCNQTLGDPSSTANSNTLRFGLYARDDGVFNARVTMTSGPSLMGGVSAVYGYAANVDSQENCPPGLEKRFVYTSLPSNPASNANNSGGTFTFDSTKSNFDSSLSESQILTASEGNSATYPIKAYDGGDCNVAGTACTAFPDLDDSSNLLSTVNQSLAQDSSAFCVIPSDLIN